MAVSTKKESPPPRPPCANLSGQSLVPVEPEIISEGLLDWSKTCACGAKRL